MLRVYFCEPTDSMRGTIQSFFKTNSDYEVKVFQNGATFLNTSDTLPPDLAVLDIDANGLRDVYLALSESIPVILTSTRMEEEIESTLVRLRHEAVFYKPYSLFDLTNELNRILLSAEKVKLGSKSIDERLSNIFIRAGIPPHIKGYQYLRMAVKLAINQPDIVNSITKKLYPTVAEYFDTSASKVERAIRHAIEVAWSRGKIENINAIFGIKIYGKGEKPTNGELIALVADKMVIEMMPE